MIKSITLSLLSSLLLLASACSKDDIGNFVNDSDLSQEEIIQGLKEALIVGTDTSTSLLSASGGYFNDQAVKILLPENIRQSISTFQTKSFTVLGVNLTGQQLYDGYSNSLLGINIPGLSSKEDQLVVGINTAAEQAAATATPIFREAITGISISDATNILFGGDNTAATSYLEQETSSSLFANYEPKIDQALTSVKIGNSSVVDSYEDFVNSYNDMLNTTVGIFGTIGSLTNMQTVSQTDLSAYATQKGLDGLFLKIGEEEKDIRENPIARVNSILQNVFGELD
tara:strand:- start:406 stop:1260 length:855 start_codon:yes stop_codon:yes gene_type:complete